MDERPSPDLLGLESGRARLVEYQPAWVALFEEEAARIRGALGDRILTVEHVGSTAIPGMPAKPVLDLLVGIPSFAHGLELHPALATLGYEHRPDEEIPDRLFFRRRLPDGRRTHHLSLAEPASHHYRVTICFRDYLRTHPDAAFEYRLLKEGLAETHMLDRSSYSEGKTAFVQEILRQAGCAERRA